MGFSQFRVQKALIINMFNTQSALEWLITHGSDPDIDEPLSHAQLLQLTTFMGALRQEPSPVRYSFVSLRFFLFMVSFQILMDGGRRRAGDILCASCGSNLAPLFFIFFLFSC